MPLGPVETCRWCGAPIRWIRTAATGALMPLDADPSAVGNVEVVDGLAVVHSQPTLDAGERWLPHFVTCPNQR